MLMNVIAAIDAAALDEGWARACQPDASLFFAPPSPPQT
jgi:hypothetical protein